MTYATHGFPRFCCFQKELHRARIKPCFLLIWLLSIWHSCICATTCNAHTHSSHSTCWAQRVTCAESSTLASARECSPIAQRTATGNRRPPAADSEYWTVAAQHRTRSRKSHVRLRVHLWTVGEFVRVLTQKKHSGYTGSRHCLFLNVERSRKATVSAVCIFRAVGFADIGRRQMFSGRLNCKSNQCSAVGIGRYWRTYTFTYARFSTLRNISGTPVWLRRFSFWDKFYLAELLSKCNHRRANTIFGQPSVGMSVWWQRWQHRCLSGCLVSS